MAEVGAAVVGAASTSVIAHVEREVRYLVHFTKNIANLESKAQELAAARVDLQRLIDASLNNNEVIKESVTNWLEKVGTVLEDTVKLTEKAGTVKATKLSKVRLVSRFKLGRMAFKKIAEIQGLLTEKSGFGSVGDSKPFQSLEIVSAGKFDSKPFQSLEIVSAGKFEVFASREYATKKIIDTLQNNQVSMIGVYGMPGIGKTVLMKAITKQGKDKKLFDEVVMVIVSQYPHITAIQKNIAEQLGLDLGESSKVVAATKLSARLSQGKKVLIALDDIWEALDMEEVGIPCSFHGCKVLFTTRRESVCDRMEVHEKIEVGILADTDGWKLFRQKAGDVVDSSSHLEVARDVFSECKGLPLAIVTLGLALRNKVMTVWLDARKQLKKSNFKGEGMDRVISIVKLSYTFLSDDKARMCFLFCSLFPEDFRIEFDVLLSYMLGEELLRKEDNMEEARNGLHTVIDTLTSSGILLRSEEGAIMMHDVIRDAAIRIASDPKEGEGFIVRSGLGLEYWPSLDREMEKCRRLSLMWNDLKLCPPHLISAANLLTLSLSRNFYIEEIPSDFFKEMKQLKTLDLSKTSIKALPESFRCLQSLRTLYMDRCHDLIDISLVGELERLEILSICSCWRTKIPVSLQKLTNLRMLNARGVQSLFPPKVISSLIRLEELYLGHEANDMIAGGRNLGMETDPLVFLEVASLTRMTRLRIRLPVECLWEDIPTSNLKNLSTFSILVGQSSMVLFSSYNQRRVACLNLESSIQDLELSTWIGALLENTEILELCNFNRLQNVADLNANGLYSSSLSQLNVNHCKLLKHLVSTTSVMKSIFRARKPLLFSNLQELRLCNLEKFVAICDGPIPEGFLCKLKILEVSYCPTVSPNLIPFDLLGNLQMLEQLELYECEKLVELLKGSSMSKQPPSLIFPSLRIIDIWGCDKLKCVLPLKAARHLLQQLEEVKIWSCSAMEKQPPSLIFPSLRIILIEACSNLKCVIPLKAARHLLQQLEELYIRDCYNMETIFEGDDGDKATLPQLTTLYLEDLPSLSSVGPPGLLFDFPALIDMTATECGNLKRLPLLGKQSIPKLKKLVVSPPDWLDGLEWEDESLKDHLKSHPGLMFERQ